MLLDALRLQKFAEPERNSWKRVEITRLGWMRGIYSTTYEADAVSFVVTYFVFADEVI